MTDLTTAKAYGVYQKGTILQDVVDAQEYWRGTIPVFFGFGLQEVEIPKHVFEADPELYFELKQLLVRVVQIHGKAEVLAILDKFKSNRLVDLDEQYYSEAVELAKQVLARPPVPDYMLAMQNHTRMWTRECFGGEIAGDIVERNHRFLEESLELVQAGGCTKAEALQLVDYVYSRPAGVLKQEVGGVMVTLAALCNAREIDMLKVGETELARCFENIERIRAKQKAKPKFGPLPEE